MDATEFLLLESLIIGGCHESEEKQVLVSQQKIRISSHISLAKYHLVVHPKDAERLPKILLLLRALKAAITVEVIAAEFFSGDTTLVLLFVNNIILNEH